MKIEVNIPALDRFCDLIENHGGFSAITPTPPATTKVADEEEPAKEKPAKKKAKDKPAAKKDDPTVTVEDVVKVGKEYVELASPTKLRAVLDTIIPGEKITTCDKSNYPALLAALEKAVAAEKEEL